MNAKTVGYILVALAAACFVVTAIYWATSGEPLKALIVTLCGFMWAPLQIFMVSKS